MLLSVEFVKDPCVSRWLKGLAERSRGDCAAVLERFFRFAGFEPVRAVEFQRANLNSYVFVDRAYEWVEGRKLRVRTMKTQVGIVRGFFLANRAPLPRDKHRFHSEKMPVVGELSIAEFRKILSSCNLTYRAAFLLQFQSGSGAGEVVYINEHHAGHVFDEVRKGSQLIRLTMPGRKQHRNVESYYTFIGSDAIDVLQQLFHSRGWKRDSVLFRNGRGKPVTTSDLQAYFRSQAFKVGVIKQYTPKCMDCEGETVKQIRRTDGSKTTFFVCTVCHGNHAALEYYSNRQLLGGIRYRMRTHELRDLFRTQWHYAQRYVGVDPDVAEFIMGHTGRIDPLQYDKIMRDVKAARAEYRKAMPFLNVTSEDPTRVDRSDVEGQFESMKKEIAELKKLFRQEAEWALPKIMES